MELSDAELKAELDAMPVEQSLEEVLEVKSAGGLVLSVVGQREKEWFETVLKKYQQEYLFENIADLQDLDRLMGLELLSYRYTIWLVMGHNYAGKTIIDKDIRVGKEKWDTEIRLLKNHMGMDRKNRMQAESESTGDFLKNLLRRAHEFGIHRDHQIAKAMDLIYELSKLVGLHDRTDAEEQSSLGVTEHQIIGWIREVVVPEFMEIDAAFRKNQKLWIKDLT